MSTAHPVAERELKKPGYELFILGLSILSLVNLAITVCHSRLMSRTSRSSSMYPSA
jgi:hypothetical protein